MTNDVQPPPSPITGRLQFIDALRGYAILMMLQGHFVYTMLDPAFRDESVAAFSTWSFLRGMTAPIFFTITGIIFVYLLLRQAAKPAGAASRIRKGLRRGAMLIGLGYLLQINVFAFMGLQWNGHWWTIDVLPCIGLAILGLIGLYSLSQNIPVPLPLLLLLTGLGLFFLDPVFSAVDYSAWPRPLANLFTRDFGSSFTPIPWVGYTFLGGAVGWHLYRFTQLYRKAWFPLLLVALGWWLHSSSSAALMDLHAMTGWEGFKTMAWNNYLFIRLGHVLLVLAAFLWLEIIFGQFPRLLLKAGQETLTIYAVHYVLLYGTWLGLGVTTFGKYTWAPWPTVIGAALFVLAFLFLVHYLESLRASWQQRVQPQMIRQWRFQRIRAERLLRHRYRVWQARRA